MAKELIAITAVYYLADETGRQHLLSLVKALLTSSKTPVSFIPALSVSSPSPKNYAALVQQERAIMAKQLEVAKLRVKLNEAK